MHIEITISGESAEFHSFLDVIYQAAAQLNRIEERMSTQAEQIKAFSDTVTAQLTQIGTSLDNIAADEAGLAKQVSDLQTQLANAGSLTPEQQAALDAIAQNATQMATRTQQIADAVPDALTPPVA